MEERDLLSDLQDISDSERKTSSAESSSGTWGCLAKALMLLQGKPRFTLCLFHSVAESGSGSEEGEEEEEEEEEEEGSTSEESEEEEEEDEEEEEEETGSNSEEASEQSAGEYLAGCVGCADVKVIYAHCRV